MSTNRAIIMGRLARDPDLRYTPKGTAVADFSVALNHTWKTDAGEKREEVTFVDVTAWGRQAEVIGQYFRKGKGILVEGRLKQDKWQDKNTGQDRSKLGVVLESFDFPPGDRQDGASSPSRTTATTATRPAPEPDAAPQPEDDDVPF